MALEIANFANSCGKVAKGAFAITVTKTRKNPPTSHVSALFAIFLFSNIAPKAPFKRLNKPKYINIICLDGAPYVRNYVFAKP